MEKDDKGKFKRGNSGRKPGARNKTTTEVKEFYTEFVKKNEGKMQGWLDRIAKKNPAKAFELLLRASEFVYPKKRTIDVSGLDHLSDEAIETIVNSIIEKAQK